MGIQSNINSGISTLSYILSLGKKFNKQDEKITENEKGIKENKENIVKNANEIEEQAADIYETKAEVDKDNVRKVLTKKPFDPFDKQIEEFKSKLSADEIALLDAQESRKPGSTRNLVDNYIRGRMRHEKNSAFFRNRADRLMSNSTQDDLNDPKFMERIKRYENWGTAPFITQSQFLSEAEKKHYYDTAEERANMFSHTPVNRKTREEVATANASDRLQMDVENKMKQESLKEERRNILQNMNTDLNNIPRGDM